MDSLDTFRKAITDILADYSRDPYAYGDIQFEIVCDRPQDRYLLLINGWDGDKRVYGPLIHCDIIDGKVWIQYDGTEDGVAFELLRCGVPKEQIVLGFRPPAVREHTDFGVT
jgi:hypothetical protein